MIIDNRLEELIIDSNRLDFGKNVASTIRIPSALASANASGVDLTILTSDAVDGEGGHNNSGGNQRNRKQVNLIFCDRSQKRYGHKKRFPSEPPGAEFPSWEINSKSRQVFFCDRFGCKWLGIK